MQREYTIAEDSRSITDFFKPSKLETIREKKEKKDLQDVARRKRRDSTQMSIFGWLAKNRPKQNCQITNLPKNLIISIYGYLRVFEIVRVSQCCYYFSECAKSIWHDWEFFGQVDTEKLSAIELKKVIEKSAIMQHIKQLRSFYMGKNLGVCREKIKLKVKKSSCQQSLKPVNGRLLESFQICPQVKKSNSFLMDSHLQQVIHSSFRSLTSIKLQSCHYLRKFNEIHKCQELTTLVITNNSYFSTDDLRLICKACPKIEHLDLSGCDGLEQGIFRHISKLENLQHLVLNNYYQPFGDLQILSGLLNLRQISCENSCIVDAEAMQICKQVPNLRFLNLNGCRFLTDFLVQWLLASWRGWQGKCLVNLSLRRSQVGEKVISQYEEELDKFSHLQLRHGV